MKNLSKVFVGIAMAGTMLSCQQGGGGVQPVSQTEVAKADNHDVRFNYAIGANFTKQLLNDSITVLPEAVIAGMMDMMKDELKMTEEEMVAEIRRFDSIRQSEMMAKTQAASQAFLSEYRDRDGVVETASGLMYRIIQRGEGGAKAEANDQAVVYYKGMLADGTVFDQTKPGSPATFPVGGLIPGFTEGLMLMQAGDKFEFCIPSELGYGQNGNQRIPPNSTLVFEVELVDVKKGQ